MATGRAERGAGASSAFADVRRNVIALGAEYALYDAGLNFVSMATVLPAFAERLGASNLVIGAIPALMTLGWFVPGIFAASHTEGLARKLPFILKYTQRVPFLAIALLALVLATSHPTLVLVAFLALLTLATVTGGALIPAWLDLVGRVIPSRLRGRFFAMSNAAGGLIGMGTAGAASYLLSTYPFPLSYALCFAGASALMLLAFGVMTRVREPEASSAKLSEPIMAYLRRLPSVLAGQPNFRWFVAARALGLTAVTMASGLYIVYALNILGATEAYVGLSTFVFLAAKTVGNFGLGAVADRAGHKLVMVVSSVAALGMNVLALASGSATAFVAIFILMGVAWAAINASGFAILLEFASEGDRPTYVALGNLALGPFALAAPLLGGWLADTVSYDAAFGVAAASGIASALLLIFRVRDPRFRPSDGVA